MVDRRAAAALRVHAREVLAALHVRRGDIALAPGGVRHPDPARALVVGLGHRHGFARRAWQLAVVTSLKVVQAGRRGRLKRPMYRQGFRRDGRGQGRGCEQQHNIKKRPNATVTETRSRRRATSPQPPVRVPQAQHHHRSNHDSMTANSHPNSDPPPAHRPRRLRNPPPRQMTNRAQGLRRVMSGRLRWPAPMRAALSSLAARRCPR